MSESPRIGLQADVVAGQAHNPTVRVVRRELGATVSRPLSAEHPDDERWPGLLLVRVEGRVFFANAERVGDPSEPPSRC